MHIHPNQINASLQLDSMYAAEKAAAKRDVERTRRKLLQFASELSAEAASGEDCVVMLETHQEGKKQQFRPPQGGRKKQKADADSPNVEHSISDWV